MSKTETLEKREFTLPNEIITVRYINRKRGMAANQEVREDHVIYGGMLNTAVRKFSAPLMRNGSVANVLTAEEKEYLEKVTGLELSVYGDFWTTFKVALYKDDSNNRFDLSQPQDYISYKVLKSLSKYDIAPSWDARNTAQTYQFAITREGEQMLEEKKGFDNKKEAFKLYGKIEDDRNKLLGVLKLLTNKPISKDSSLQWLQHKVEEFIDKMPSQFVNVYNDKAFYTKLLINTAIDEGIIVKNGNKYSTADGLDLCEAGESPTFDNAVTYLDNPLHQDVRTIVEAKLNK